MRASRLLRMLLILQNRGRQTAVALATELEVAPRTILRDVDALTEAGLPIIAHRGNQGGIELGFNYRTRLTGLDADEAEAMAVILARPMPELAALGLAAAAARARAKTLESFPDHVRQVVERASRQFRFATEPDDVADPRVPALAAAVRGRNVVRIGMNTPAARVIHPLSLLLERGGWQVVDACSPTAPIPVEDCGTINVSARTFDVAPESQDAAFSRP
ncbi:MAG: HTH domain-containing protein [Bauldia sp.]|nr:HTH domain-containing protein [Bauldia sp.]